MKNKYANGYKTSFKDYKNNLKFKMKEIREHKNNQLSK